MRTALDDRLELVHDRLEDMNRSISELLTADQKRENEYQMLVVQQLPRIEQEQIPALEQRLTALEEKIA